MRLESAFRRAAVFEGLSLILLLFVAIPLKYWYEDPTLVRLLGPSHGMAFLIYQYLLLRIRLEESLSGRLSFVFFLASFIPFGTFVAIRAWTQK